MTYAELLSKIKTHNEENNVQNQFGDPNRLYAVIVFDNKSFKDDYSLESRSYAFTSDNKFFISRMMGRSIFAKTLDGSESGVRLDWYINDWVIEDCYFITKEEYDAIKEKEN